MIKRSLLFFALWVITLSTVAQNSATLYWLDNAPMRHLLNPSFIPVSDGYVSLTPLGYTSTTEGNNSLCMSDLIFNIDGQTVTALHPKADRQAFLQKIQPTLTVEGDADLNLLSFGFRVQENHYIHVNVLQHISVQVGVPHSVFDFTLGGGMQDIDGGVNTYDLSRLSAHVDAYTEFGLGYAHHINEHWDVGAKLKFLVGEVYSHVGFQNLDIQASSQEWQMNGSGQMLAAVPVENPFDSTATIVLRPSGYGAALDLGVTYRPIEQIEFSAAVTDLGFICWQGQSLDMQNHSQFQGAGKFDYNHYVVNGQFSTDSLMNDIARNLRKLYDDTQYTQQKAQFTRMPTARFQLGFSSQFIDRLLSVGVVYNGWLRQNTLTSEVTLGGAVRPCNWFNLALSYSLLNNGKYSNIGAGISLMPYDGINLTFAADYVPTSYVPWTPENQSQTYYLPYKTQGINLSMGLSIVWGTNRQKENKNQHIIKPL